MWRSYIIARQMEAGRGSMTRYARCKIWLCIFPTTNPLTVRPAERHMGWGKGSPEYRVKPNTFINGLSLISAEQLLY